MGWSRRWCAEDEAFEGRQGLLCRVQEADVILKTAGCPCRVLSRVDKTRLRFKKGPSGSGMKTLVAKGQDWW